MKNFIFGLLAAVALYGLFLLASKALEQPQKPSLANDTPVSPQAQLVQARRTALKVWGRAPCHGNFTVTRTRFTKSSQAGQATWYQTGGPKTYTNCTIVIADRPFSYTQLCAVTTHEVGHLLGLKHSNNPKSVMYAYSRPSNFPKSCRRAS